MTSKQRLAYAIATWFGCGYSRFAPGTAGALGTVPLHLALCWTPSWLHWSAVVLFSLLGIWSAGVVADHRGDDDPSLVVIDEVAGTLIALGAVRTASWQVQLLAFALFRLLDITKPPPIRQLEHAKPPGLGIMLDDLLAGVTAGAFAWFVCSRGWLPL